MLEDCSIMIRGGDTCHWPNVVFSLDSNMALVSGKSLKLSGIWRHGSGTGIGGGDGFGVGSFSCFSLTSV
jgi:hypothetical protein